MKLGFISFESDRETAASASAVVQGFPVNSQMLLGAFIQGTWKAVLMLVTFGNHLNAVRIRDTPEKP